MDEYTLLVIGDIEYQRRLTLLKLKQAEDRIVELEAGLAEKEQPEK